MSQELGKIEKPEVGSFKHNRKILQVPLIYAGKDAPVEYAELFEKYWNQVAENIAKLESRLGSVTVVFHETVSTSGEEGLKILETLNVKSHELACRCCKGEARLHCVEDPDMLTEVMDWERCLVMGFLNNKVAAKIYEFYSEANRKRYQFISKAIDDAMKDGDVALLFIREGHLVQFPPDIDVFSVAPPALDEIHRWARDRAAKREKVQDTES